MSKRNPNDPIPGFEDEFTGTIGHEKRIHKTHFEVTSSVKLEKGGYNSMYEWVEIKPGKWKLVKKEQENA